LENLLINEDIFNITEVEKKQRKFIYLTLEIYTPYIIAPTNGKLSEQTIHFLPAHDVELLISLIIMNFRKGERQHISGF